VLGPIGLFCYALNETGTCFLGVNSRAIVTP